MKHDVGKIAFLIILIVGLCLCARVYGLSAYQITVFDSIAFVILAVAVCILALFVYRFVISSALRWYSGDDSKSDMSMYPLFSIIGNLVIILATLYVILSRFGVDLLVIVTSMGIVGLAISFGAQSTLSQVFNGLTLMLTRTFRSGDIVRINNSDTRLIVRSVGIMATQFQSMENEEIFYMPNTSVASSTIVNMTREGRVYCAIISFETALLTTDMERTREIVLNIANEHPHVITDGSYPKPYLLFKSTDKTHARVELFAFIDDVRLKDFIESEIRAGMIEGLRTEGKGVIRPQLDVHMRD